MIRRSGVLAAFSVVLFLAGCAGNAADTGAAGDSSVPPTTSAPAVPSTDPSSPGTPDPATSDLKPATGTVETLKGQVIAGVEPGCLVLMSAQGSHLLVLSGDLKTTVKVGDTVTVTGRADPGMMTTCQQGTPFVVATVDAG